MNVSTFNIIKGLAEYSDSTLELELSANEMFLPQTSHLNIFFSCCKTGQTAFFCPVNLYQSLTIYEDL